MCRAVCMCRVACVCVCAAGSCVCRVSSRTARKNGRLSPALYCLFGYNIIYNVYDVLIYVTYFDIAYKRKLQKYIFVFAFIFTPIKCANYKPLQGVQGFDSVVGGLVIR